MNQKGRAEQQNRYLDFVISGGFLGVNRLFVLPFENNDNRTSYTRYYLPLVETKDYDIMINGRNFLDKPVIDLSYKKNYYKMIE